MPLWASSALPPPARSVSADTPCAPSISRWPEVANVLCVAAVLAAGVAAVRLGRSPLTAASVLSVVAAATVVGVRRRHPRAAMVAVVLLAGAGLSAGGPAVAYLVAGLIALFTVAASTDRRTTFAYAVGCAVAGTGLSLLFPPIGWNGLGAIIQQIVQIGFAAAAGDATRSRRAYIRAVTERARRAEETKESEARRRVAEERLSIARDLHDVVAHQIAVINLHANVASQNLRRNPDDVEPSLVTIRQAARTVLGDIASLLNVLRASDPTAAGKRGVAVPGLDGLAPLLAEFGRSGLHVDLRKVGGEGVELPQAVEVVAYRIIQEALTNAHKHGPDHAALLQIEYEDNAVEITVTNTTATALHERGAGRAGLGLLGAQERVATIQGTLHTSYGPGPVHRLTAHLPMAAVAKQAQPAAPGQALSIPGEPSP